MYKTDNMKWIKLNITYSYLPTLTKTLHTKIHKLSNYRNANKNLLPAKKEIKDLGIGMISIVLDICELFCVDLFYLKVIGLLETFKQNNGPDSRFCSLKTWNFRLVRH